MTKVISLNNNKGGVGKTTSVIVFSEILAYLGKRVLCVDQDPQSNLSLSFHCFHDDSDDVLNGRVAPAQENIAELYKFRYRTSDEVKKLIQHTHLTGVDIIPSSKRHKKTALEVYQNTGNNNIILKKALKCVENDYDYILIDNAPASDVLTVNSIFASNYITIPVRVEGFSYKGLKETLADLIYIKEEHDLEQVEFLGTFITQVNVVTNAYKERRKMCEDDLKEKFLKTPIRVDTKINEVESKMVPLLTYSNRSSALVDYIKLLLEMDILDPDSMDILTRSISE